MGLVFFNHRWDREAETRRPSGHHHVFDVFIVILFNFSKIDETDGNIWPGREIFLNLDQEEEEGDGKERFLYQGPFLDAHTSQEIKLYF